MGNKKKRKIGAFERNPLELQDKTPQQLHQEVKGLYCMQLTDCVKYLDSSKYNTLEKLARFKEKHPGCFMKNNLNNMQAKFNDL